MNEQTRTYKRIREDDLSCGQYWLSYSNEAETDFHHYNSKLIESFFLFTKGLVLPYSLNLTFSTFDTYWIPEERLVSYQLRLNKPHIYKNSTIELLGTFVKEVTEITPSEIKTLLDTIQQENKHLDKLIGIENISCLSGLFFLPEKTEETECIIYVGPGGEGFERKHPIYQGMGIEAPLEASHDIWAPIEISLGDDWSNLKLSLILNWDLYGRYNKAGFMMLKRALKNLIDQGWKNEMPERNNPFQ